MDRSTLPQLVNDLLSGLCCYCFSGAIVLFGLILGTEFLRPPRPDTPHVILLESFFRFDGEHYRQIASDGYEYVPGAGSDVAFFPLYPCVARAICAVSGCSPEWGLLSVTHISLAASFVLLSIYTRYRTAGEVDVLPALVVSSFALLPSTFFFRMAYSEAIFIALTLLTLLGVERSWPVAIIAFLTGLTTAARPVGVALVPVFLLHLWRRSTGLRGFFLHTLFLAPLACGGLLAYMGYQWWAFGEPLAFVKTQEFWRAVPPTSWTEKARSLALLEPLWEAFVLDSPRYWERFETHDNPFFSMLFVNPIAFMATTGLIALGTFKRWLNSSEWILSLGLLAIPYVTRGYDNAMRSSARFAAAVVPVYLVLGHLLRRMPSPLPGLIAGLSAFFLGAYAALFAAGYRLY